MADDPRDAVAAAIRAAFVAYPKQGDPDCRAPDWIMPDQCEHLTNEIIRELEAKGFQLTRPASGTADPESPGPGR